MEKEPLNRREWLILFTLVVCIIVPSCSKTDSSSSSRTKKKKTNTSQTEIVNTETEIETEDIESISIPELITVDTTSDFSEDSKPIQDQKNGFDIETNKTVVVGDYSFSVPEYWLKEDTDQDTFSAFAEDSLSKSKLLIFITRSDNVGVSVKLESDVKNGGFLKKIENTFEKCGPIEVQEYEKGEIKGYFFIHDFSNYGADGHSMVLAFPSYNDKDFYMVWLLQADSSEYSYTDDFWKILDSIQSTHLEEKNSVFEQTPSPTPVYTPTPSPTPLPTYTPTPTPKPTNTPTPTPTPKPKKHRYEYAYKWYNPNTYTTVYWLFDTDNKAFLMQLNSSSVGDGGFYKGTFKNGKTITLTFYYEGEPEELPPGENPWRVTIHDSYISVQTNVGSPSEFTKIDVSEVDYLLGDAAFD